MRVTNNKAHKLKRKKVMKATKGFHAGRGRLYRTSKDALMKAGLWAYRDRKKRKIFFRRLWIARINVACRNHGVTYSTFMHALKQANIQLNRKSLSELAIQQPLKFTKIVETIQPHIK